MFANVFLIYVGVLTLCLKQNIQKFDAFENRLHNAELCESLLLFTFDFLCATKSCSRNHIKLQP